MLFVEPTFLFAFLPLTLAAFYFLAARFGPVGGFLAISFGALAFYAPHGASAIALLLASLTVNLAIGLALTRPEGVALPARARLALLIAGLVYDFGALGLFKYLNALALLLGGPEAARPIPLDIPSGISFYTFHQAVFLVDCWARRPETTGLLRAGANGKPEAKSVLAYAGFVLLFPQLVIGPISYLREMAPQFVSRRFGAARRLDIEVGLTLIVVGLFKKIIIADGLAKFVDPAFAALAEGGQTPRLIAISAMLGYSAQLYFDFSGYSDAALGLARLFGLRLPINFYSPLRAVGIVDFYRRWHMTLTRVIARFLFTPLSLAGARFAAERRLGALPTRLLSLWAPLMLNFQIIALWHGLTTTFIAFGLIHGVWYVLESEIRTTKGWRAYRKRSSETRRRLIGQAIAFLPLLVTFALFRCDSLASFGRLMRSLAFGGGGQFEMRGDMWALLAFAYAIIWFAPNVYELLRHYRPGIATFANETNSPAALRLIWRPTLPWGLFVAGLAIAVLLRLNNPTPFLYGGF